MYVHDGAGWSHLGAYSTAAATTTGSTLSGASFTWSSTVPKTDPALEFSDLSKYKNKDKFPSRELYLALEIQKHKMSTSSVKLATSATDTVITCTCSPDTKDITIPWEIHLAKVLVKASDDWDQLLMQSDGEIDDEEEI